MSELSKKIGLALETRKLINERKSDYDINNQWQASNTNQYTGEAIEAIGHNHTFLVDDFGCGKTSVDQGHFHMIERYDIMPESSDNHTHVLKMQECTEAVTTIGYTQQYDSNNKVTTEYPPIAHSHELMLDEYGNGISSEFKNHTHKIRVFQVLSAKDGHSHYGLEQKRLSKIGAPWNLGV
jgi:hypothetical protein